MKDNIGIYVIYSVSQNKYYFGKAYNFQKRKNAHLCCLRKGNHHNHYLQKSWNKYGENNFVFSLVHPCSLSNLKILERFYIKTCNSIAPYGFNLTTGGEGERKTKESYVLAGIAISKARKGMKFTDEHRKNISLSHRGPRPYRRGIPMRVKTYTYRSPQNEVFTVTNIKKFALNNSLDSSCMIKLAKRK